MIQTLSSTVLTLAVVTCLSYHSVNKIRTWAWSVPVQTNLRFSCFTETCPVVSWKLLGGPGLCACTVSWCNLRVDVLYIICLNLKLQMSLNFERYHLQHPQLVIVQKHGKMISEPCSLGFPLQIGRLQLQSNLSNMDGEGTEQSGHIRVVSVL